MISVTADIPMIATLFHHDELLSFCVTAAGAAGAEIPDGRRGVVRPRLVWETCAHRASEAASTFPVCADPGPAERAI
jgi:hypothetical protein